MKKVFKSISVLVLSLSLVFSGFVFAGNVKADAVSDWKANAIKTPTEENLIGAGYIDVEFDNSLSGYTYEVFLDGNPVYWKNGNILRPELSEDESQGTRKTFTSSDTPKTEVYTTSVAKHELTVKATNGSSTITSNPRTFFVSKKGLAMGDNMGTKVSLKKLNCSWYYNWGTEAFNNPIDADVPHIPMMWGGYDDSKEDMQNLATNSNYILGFNEPELASQANMVFWDAVEVWNDYISPLKMRKVSPGPTSPSGTSVWLRRFMNGDYICHNTWLNDGSWGLYYDYKDEASKKFIAGVSDDTDAVALHYYMDRMDIDGLMEAIDNLWNDYHKPIWITEIGLFGKKGKRSDISYELADKRAEVQSYVRELVTRLSNDVRVERFCWFPYDVDSTNDIDEFDGAGGASMFEYATGLYTELGQMYASIGNPAGYSANSVSSSELFDWNNRVRTDVDFNSASDSLKVSWTSGALNNLGSVSILIDDNEYSINNGDVIDTSGLDEGKHSVYFVLYDTSNKEIIKKARSFTIDRTQPITQEQTTNVVTTTQNANPIVVTTVNRSSKNTSANKPVIVALSKAKNVKKKSVKLIWSAVKGVKKYRVQWALNKKFTKKRKQKIIKKVGFKITKLKKKKTYFFRVAAINGYGQGPWSNVKKVKIKK